MPRKPSACSPTVPAALPASTAALAAADWAKAGTARATAPIEAATARIVMVLRIMSVPLLEQVRVLLDQRLDFLVQSHAHVGVQLGVDVDRVDLDPHRRSARREGAHREEGKDQGALHGGCLQFS